MGQHQFDGLGLVEIGLLFIGELAKRGARAVQDNLPAVLVTPLRQVLAVDAQGLVIMKAVIHGMIIEPGPRFLHGIARFDSIQVQRIAVISHGLPPWKKR
ncbi:hypothetical protein D9M72_625500 [compost metagenome]